MSELKGSGVNFPDLATDGDGLDSSLAPLVTSRAGIKRTKSSSFSKFKWLILISGLLILINFTVSLVIELASHQQVAVANSVSIAILQKWNPAFWFGNQDDPLPPADYHPSDHHRVLSWYCRNPLHNFTFYIMGIADKNFIRVGRFPTEVFSPQGGWNWAVCQFGWLRLPFISYRSNKIELYLGWRDRGNFGIKINTSPQP